MLRMSLPARGRNRAGIGSTLALALALAGGAVAAPALAQAPAAQAQPEYKPSRGFGRVYEPVAAIANSAAIVANLVLIFDAPSSGGSDAYVTCWRRGTCRGQCAPDRCHELSGAHRMLDELGRAEAHHLLAVAVGRIAHSEAHLLPLHAEDALVGDRHPVRVAPEILQHLRRAA